MKKKVQSKPKRRKVKYYKISVNERQTQKNDDYFCVLEFEVFPRSRLSFQKYRTKNKNYLLQNQSPFASLDFSSKFKSSPSSEVFSVFLVFLPFILFFSSFTQSLFVEMFVPSRVRISTLTHSFIIHRKSFYRCVHKNHAQLIKLFGVIYSLSGGMK